MISIDKIDGLLSCVLQLQRPHSQERNPKVTPLIIGDILDKTYYFLVFEYFTPTADHFCYSNANVLFGSYRNSTNKLN
jgi:hypothetical protein